MRRLTFIVFVFVAALPLAQCTFPLPQTPKVEPTATVIAPPSAAVVVPSLNSGNLRVWVRDRDSGAYIISASVKVEGPSGMQTGETDLSGQAYFGVLPLGTYSVSATFKNYLPSQPEKLEIVSGTTVVHTLYLVIPIPTATKTSVPVTSLTTTPTPSPTATGGGQATAVPLYGPVNLYDPPNDSKLSTNSTVLRWKTDHNLKGDEEFEILVWPEGSAEQTRIASTRDTNFSIDFRVWKLGNITAKFFWTVRIIRQDGTQLSSPANAVSFFRDVPGEKPPAPPPGPRPYPAPPVFQFERKQMTTELQLTGLFLFTVAVVCVVNILSKQRKKQPNVFGKQRHAPTSAFTPKKA